MTYYHYVNPKHNLSMIYNSIMILPMSLFSESITPPITLSLKRYRNRPIGLKDNILAIQDTLSMSECTAPDWKSTLWVILFYRDHIVLEWKSTLKQSESTLRIVFKNPHFGLDVTLFWSGFNFESKWSLLRLQKDSVDVHSFFFSCVCTVGLRSGDVLVDRVYIHHISKPTSAKPTDYWKFHSVFLQLFFRSIVRLVSDSSVCQGYSW